MKKQNFNDLNLKEPSYRRDYFGVEHVEWGDKNHVKSKKQYMKISSLKITNRFDFANDADLLVRNYKENNKKIPNIFNLKIKQKDE